MLSADATPDTANAVDPRTRTLVLVTSRFDDNPRRTSRRPWPEANSSGWTSTCTTPGPDDDVDGLLTGTFHFHPLAVTSAVRFGQRPRIDNFDDFTQVITFGMAGDGKDVAGIHCFINEKFVVTLHQGKCPALLAVVLQRVRDHRDTQIPPQVGLLYLILDSLIDSFFPVLSDMDDDIDNLESAILKNPTEEQLGTLFDMKKRVMTIRRVVAPQRDMIESLNGGVVSIPA